MTGRLAGVRVVSLAGTLPGPVAARRLRAEGAEVIRVEGPGGGGGGGPRGGRGQASVTV